VVPVWGLRSRGSSGPGGAEVEILTIFTSVSTSLLSLSEVYTSRCVSSSAETGAVVSTALLVAFVLSVVVVVVVVVMVVVVVVEVVVLLVVDSGAVTGIL